MTKTVRVHRIQSGSLDNVVYAYEVPSYDAVREEDKTELLMLLAAADVNGYSYVLELGFINVYGSVIVVTLYAH